MKSTNLILSLLTILGIQLAAHASDSSPSFFNVMCETSENPEELEVELADKIINGFSEMVHSEHYLDVSAPSTFSYTNKEGKLVFKMCVSAMLRKK